MSVPEYRLRAISALAESAYTITGGAMMEVRWIPTTERASRASEIPFEEIAA